MNAECLTVEPQGNRIEVGVACAEGGPNVEGSHLLLAVGRRPNTDDLGLDAAGLDHNARGHIQVNDALQTNVPDVWAWANAMAAGHSPIPRTTTTRSSRPTCCAATHAE